MVKNVLRCFIVLFRVLIFFILSEVVNLMICIYRGRLFLIIIFLLFVYVFLFWIIYFVVLSKVFKNIIEDRVIGKISLCLVLNFF